MFATRFLSILANYNWIHNILTNTLKYKNLKIDIDTSEVVNNQYNVIEKRNRGK